jgi:hypothetical protein
VETRLHLDILPQPDPTTCGPTCLHAVYGYYGDRIPLGQVVREVPSLESGGTLAVFLACHALRRGYRARIYTYNLKLFDPTWFGPGAADLRSKLEAQARAKPVPRLRRATEAYLEFLDRGGELRLEDLTPSLIRRYLARGRPVLSGLSSTYLYRSAREIPETSEEDDVRGEPAGHFVVLCGYDSAVRQVLVADPLHPNPLAPGHFYEAEIDRVLCSILLGVITDDAKLLIIRPPERPESRADAGTDRCQ